MKTRIAYIDDCIKNLECLKSVFQNEISLETFLDPMKLIESFSMASYSSILVDLHLSSLSGFSLYEKIVEHPNYNGCPILFISSDDSSSAKIKSFELGAVDFLGRETSPEEMVARVKSKIKFYQQHRHIIEFNSLKVNLTLLKTYLKGTEVPLTFIELKILCLVLRRFPDVVPKENLAENIWKSNQAVDSTVYTHLWNLNNKLADWEFVVLSIKGKGVQLVKKEGTK